MGNASLEELLREREELLMRLEESEDALRALRCGEVDAVVVSGESERVYTLETPEQHYRLLVEHLPHAAATLTDEGVILYANRRFAGMLDRPLSALLAQKIQSLVDERSAAALQSMIGQCVTSATDGELELRAAHGAPAPLHVRLSSVPGGPLGVCLLLEDVTAQHYVEELERAQRALREADRKKDDFLATLAHELRNPLAPIRSAIEVLDSEHASPETLRHCRGILKRQLEVMTRLLEDLLDVTRAARGKLELRLDRVDLVDVLHAALETSRPVIEAARHQLDVTLTPEPLQVRGDQVRLAQVFANLLNNAAKYTEPRGHIWLRAQRHDDQIVVSIADNGIGIEPEMLPRLFEIFSQADTAIERAQGGLGIGLSLAKRVVELHGGTIEARSAGSGQGSEFVVRLPAASA